MELGSEEVFSVRFGADGKRRVSHSIALEMPVSIALNDQEVASLICSPGELDYLAAGYLYTEGFIGSGEEIRKINIDEGRGTVAVYTGDGHTIPDNILLQKVITSGCGRGAALRKQAGAPTPVTDTQKKISVSQVYALVSRFQQSSSTYLSTHGVHSAAVSDSENFITFSDDIGRLNALDKVLGRCLLDNVPLHDKILVSSGRISSEMMHKVIRGGVPICISVATATNTGILLAARQNITLICSVKEKAGMMVFTHDWRVTES